MLTIKNIKADTVSKIKINIFCMFIFVFNLSCVSSLQQKEKIIVNKPFHKPKEIKNQNPRGFWFYCEQRKQICV